MTMTLQDIVGPLATYTGFEELKFPPEDNAGQIIESNWLIFFECPTISGFFEGHIEVSKDLYDQLKDSLVL